MQKQLRSSKKRRPMDTTLRDGASVQSSGARAVRDTMSTEQRNLYRGLLSGGASKWARVPLSLGALQLNQIGVLNERQRSDTIFLDYDMARTPSLCPLYFLCRLCDLRPKTIVDHKTRRGWHRVIKFGRRFIPPEIVAIQSILGSDRRRETLNLMRVLSGNKSDDYAQSRWNLLFERKLKRRK